MRQNRRIVNIILLAIVVILGGVVALKRLSTPQSVDNDIVKIEQKAPDSLSEDSLRSSHRSELPADIVSSKSTREENKEVFPEAKTIATVDMAMVTTFPEADVRKMTGQHPFAREAAKVISGKLTVEDSLSRRKILNYCEHFRMAYNTKDIDFLRQVFSENALIIVGQKVKTGKKTDSANSDNEKVRFSVRSKNDYLRRLEKVFEANGSIDVSFSDFRILRHPTSTDIYGVTLHQKYKSDRYSDDGWLFLLWDFRNQSMPQIHVRTWQAGNSIDDADDVIGIADFNLE